MANRCSFEGCQRAVRCKNLCNAHYQQQWAGKSLKTIQIKKNYSEKICSFKDCQNLVQARGLCGGHYNQYRLDKNLKPLKIKDQSNCSYEDCDRIIEAKGLCGGHYQQLLKGQELRPLETRERNAGKKCSTEGCQQEAKKKGMCQKHYKKLFMAQGDSCQVCGKSLDTDTRAVQQENICTDCNSKRNKNRIATGEFCRICNTDLTGENRATKRENICIECLRRSTNERQRKRRENDLNYKMKEKLSSNLRSAIKSQGGLKGNLPFFNIVPYSIEEFIRHMESLFEPWMNWDNYGKYEKDKWIGDDRSTWRWSIDEIQPKSTFNLLNGDGTLNIAEICKCWALENLRPYSSKLNACDGNRRTPEDIIKIKKKCQKMSEKYKILHK